MLPVRRRASAKFVDVLLARVRLVAGWDAVVGPPAKKRRDKRTVVDRKKVIDGGCPIAP